MALDRHHVAHYALAAALACAVGAVGYGAFKSPIDKVDFTGLKPHAISIFCVPTACGTASALADQFDAAGWPETIETAIMANAGVGLKGPEALAAALGPALKAHVKWDASYDDAKPYELWLGEKARK